MTGSDDRDRGVCRDRSGTLSPEDPAKIGSKLESALRNTNLAVKVWSEHEIQASHREKHQNATTFPGPGKCEKRNGVRE